MKKFLKVIFVFALVISTFGGSALFADSDKDEHDPGDDYLKLPPLTMPVPR